MQTALRKMGNSTGMILPKAILQELGASAGTPMDVRVEDGRVIATPMRKVREGWADDAARLADDRLTAEEREWIEAPIDADPQEDW